MINPAAIRIIIIGTVCKIEGAKDEDYAILGRISPGSTPRSLSLNSADPRIGEELRGRIKSEAGRIQGEIKSAASERRAELEQQLTSLRTPPKTV